MLPHLCLTFYDMLNISIFRKQMEVVNPCLVQLQTIEYACTVRIWWLGSLVKCRCMVGHLHGNATHTHNRFTALWNLSGTTRVSWYQKKHSSTHAHRGHQSSLSAFFIYYDPWHPPYSIHMLYSLFPQSLSKSLWSTSWPGTLHFILHTFLHPIIVFFSQHKPIPSQPVPL